MPQPNKLTSAIGFSMKADKLVSGDFSVEKLARSGKARLLLLDDAASANTKEKYRALSASKNVELIEISSLGNWIGKPGRMVAAVTDLNFTTMIKRANADANSAAGE